MTGIDVSVVIPVHNAGQWLDECLSSINQQQLPPDLTLEISIFLDSCSDNSPEIVEKWRLLMQEKGYHVVVGKRCSATPAGVGFSKNKAVQQSSGAIICFMDADDVMLPDRIRIQHQLVRETSQAIVGSRFTRLPPESTRRYTDWANNLTADQLLTQAYTSHGPTLIMPTWCCRRSVFDALGGFSEAGRGEPEDLIFFYQHLRRGGKLVRAPQSLLLYRYHDSAATLAVTESRIWELRVRELQDRVLVHWPCFTIWNGGKQGRRLYRSLLQTNRDKVLCFCDVDVKKIGKDYTYEHSDQVPKPRIPIVHFQQAKPPFIICVKLDLTGGQFEQNLKSLDLVEGRDYYHFN